ncbi:MAG: type II secretion system protein [Patescibacteria group bacterium]
MNNYISKKKKAGFTLIEMMVSVGIFTVVATIVSGAFMVVVYSNYHIQQMRSLVDNVHFAIDLMSREANYGTGFEFNKDGCDPGFSFIPQEGGNEVCYKLENEQIKRNGDFLTDANIRIENFELNHYIKGTGSAIGERDVFQIVISAEADVRDEQVDFNIQNTIFQRRAG